jgi:hypothetical protein
VLHFKNASIPRSSDHRAHYSRQVRFPPKMIKIRIERRETIKERYQFWLGERSLGFGLGWGPVRRRKVKGAENGEWLNGKKRVWRRRGSEEGQVGRRVQEVRTQTPRSGLTDLRRKVRGEPSAGVRSQIPRPAFVVHRGPEEVPEERRGLQSRRLPRDDQGQGDRVDFQFSGSERVVSGRTFFFVRVCVIGLLVTSNANGRSDR